MTPGGVVDFLVRDPDNPSSVLSCLETARRNARAVRTALTADMWETLNDTWLELRGFESFEGASPERILRLLEWVKHRSLLFNGAYANTMLRNDAFYFTQLGTFLERADNTARILDVKYHVLLPTSESVGGPLDYCQWESILRAVSALRAYHWVYHARLTPWMIADLLILRPEMPRSLCACYAQITRHLELLAEAYGGRRGECHRRAGEIHARLRYGRIDSHHPVGPARVPDRDRRRRHRPRPRHRRVLPAGVAMRLAVEHRIRWRYAARARARLQLLRMTPQDGPGQKVQAWRIEVERGGRMTEHRDGYGNRVHLHTLHEWHEEIAIAVRGIVETFDVAAGAHGSSVEPVPPALFLRSTTPAAVDDPVHAFVAAARSLGKPARFASGYLQLGDDEDELVSHIWAEVWQPQLGWQGFDPAHGDATDERYVRAAVGAGAADVAPARSVRDRPLGPEAATYRIELTQDWFSNQ